MNPKYTALWASLLLASTGLALPSRNIVNLELFRRDNASVSSTLQSTPSSSAASSASTSSLPAGVLDVPADLGFEAITAEDKTFVFVELPEFLQEEQTDDAAMRRRASNYSDDPLGNISGPDTIEKWNSLKMDEFLEWYVSTKTVWGKSTLLKDSPTFLKDFWQSTGEEGQNYCDDLTGNGPCFASKPVDTAVYENLSYSVRFRAYCARVAIANWRNGISNSYRILEYSSSNSAPSIEAIRTAFLGPDATPPGDVMDVIVPALGALAVVFPAMAPVAAVVGGVAALSKVIKRDEVEELKMFPKDTPEMKLYSKRADEYAGAVETAIDLHILGNRISKLEEKNKATSDLKEWGDRAKKAGDVLEKAAKVVAGINALRPGLPSTSVNSWDTFVVRVHDLLTLFEGTVEDSFIGNKNTWAAKHFDPQDPKYKNNDATVAAQGMAATLYGGQWFGYSNSESTASKLKADVNLFYRKLILTQVMQEQAVYFTRQYFSSQAECTKAMSDLSDWMDSKSAECTGSDSGKNTWQLRSMRRPMKDTESSPRSLQGLLVTLDDWVMRIPVIPDQGSYWQMYRDYQDNSGTYPNLEASGKLKSVGIDLTPMQIFDFADACQKTKGDPFQNAFPTRDELYPGIVLDGVSITDNKASTEPVCLFSIPIFELDSELNKDWCKKGIMTRQRGEWVWKDMFTKAVIEYSEKQCPDFKAMISGAESKMCAYGKNRPGCKDHDQGAYWW